MDYLVMGWPLGSQQAAGVTRVFIRDPEAILGKSDLARGFDGAAELPSDARYTGYRDGSTRLWLDREGEFAYLVAPLVTEKWPRQKEPVLCA